MTIQQPDRFAPNSHFSKPVCSEWDVFVLQFLANQKRIYRTLQTSSTSSPWWVVSQAAGWLKCWFSASAMKDAIFPTRSANQGLHLCLARQLRCHVAKEIVWRHNMLFKIQKNIEESHRSTTDVGGLQSFKEWMSCRLESHWYSDFQEFQERLKNAQALHKQMRDQLENDQLEPEVWKLEFVWGRQDVMGVQLCTTDSTTSLRETTIRQATWTLTWSTSLYYFVSSFPHFDMHSTFSLRCCFALRWLSRGWK